MNLFQFFYLINACSKKTKPKIQTKLQRLPTVFFILQQIKLTGIIKLRRVNIKYSNN